MDQNNEKRLIASQIIVDLFEAKKAGQLLILKVQIEAALKIFRERDYPDDTTKALAEGE